MKLARHFSMTPTPRRVWQLYRSRGAGAAAMLGLLISCHAHLQPPAQNAGHLAANAAGRAADEAPPGAEARRLSARDLHLPEPEAEATVAERQFYAAATRAVRHVYEDDVDDPSQLLALRQRLVSQAHLARSQSVWRGVLDTSLERAQMLRTLGPTLRALRQALANTWRDEAAKSYRDVDAASCRIARAQMPSAADITSSLTQLHITIEPLGTYPLAAFLKFCEDPRSLFEHE